MNLRIYPDCKAELAAKLFHAVPMLNFCRCAQQKTHEAIHAFARKAFPNAHAMQPDQRLTVWNSNTADSVYRLPAHAFSVG